MISIVLLIAAGQVHLAAADADDQRWRRFVHSAVAADTPFSTRLDELRRSVRQEPAPRQSRRARAPDGPSGL